MPVDYAGRNLQQCRLHDGAQFASFAASNGCALIHSELGSKRCPISAAHDPHPIPSPVRIAHRDADHANAKSAAIAAPVEYAIYTTHSDADDCATESAAIRAPYDHAV